MLWVLKAATRQQLYSRAKVLANEPVVKDAIGGPKDFMYAPIHKIPKHDSMPNKGKTNQENQMNKPEINLENIDRFAIWKSKVPY